MTECERLIKNGFIDEGFLSTEKRCGWFVPSHIKKIWAIELDLINQVDKISKRYNLKYVLSFGSLLGAVRHGGFIPWDDDMDIAMPRKDYDKLLSLAKEFHSPYFLQTPYTDNEYFFSFAKLRNSNTSAISKKFMYQGMNEGIFIDIFPVDNFCFDFAVEEESRNIQSLIMDSSTYMRVKNPYLEEKDLERVKELYSKKNWNPLRAYEEIQRLATKYNNMETEKLSFRVLAWEHYTKYVCEKNFFDNIIYVDYEFMKLPIPKDYDSHLKKMYGDYMKYPSIEQRGTRHDGSVFDADRSYITLREELICEDRRKYEK